MTTNTLSTGHADSARGPLWRRLVLRSLQAIEAGQVDLVDPLGTVRCGRGEPRARLHVHDLAAYRRIALGGTVGAGESYVDGQWDCDDLVALTRILLMNRDALEGMDSGSAWVRQLLDRGRHLFRRNSRAGSRRNISAHYDLSNELFESFLDERMMYSSAVFPEGSASTADLDAASVEKLDRLCRKLELEPADHLLEIGTGWGGLAVHAASRYGCRVTTVTLSVEQARAARERVRAAGLDDRVTVAVTDYRDVEGQFSKVVSVEMVEAVGHQYLDDYFRALARLAAPDGLVVLQAITIADRQYQSALHSVDFIKKHVFPGSFIPCVSALVDSAARRTDLVLVNLEDIGADYALTLRAWRERFEAARPRLEELGFDERFRRLWRFYLTYCEGGFLERAISDVQLVFAKANYRGRPFRAPTPSSRPHGVES